MAPAFSCDELVVDFGAGPVLQIDELTVHPGEFLVLLGPSGAGKSTLLNLAAGRLDATRGRVHSLGESVGPGSGASRRTQRDIGHVSQSLDLVGPLRAWRNVALGQAGELSAAALIRQLSRRTPPTAVTELIDDLGLAPLTFQRTDALSGGEQQRTALARTLHQSPRLLLADEPVSALDPARSVDVLERLAEHVRAEGSRAAMLSMHEPGLGRAVATRMIGLRAGRVAFDLSPGDVTGDLLDALYQHAGDAAA